MLRRNVRPLIAVCLGIILLFSLTGCKEKKLADRDGAVKRYTYEEIDSEGFEGLFTLNSDDTFSILPSGLPGFDGRTDQKDPTRFVWYTDNGQSFTDLIPTVTEKTPIVIIYNSDASLPDKTTWYLEKYRPLGATIGAHVYLDYEDNMYLTEEGMLPGTSAAQAYRSASNNSKDKEHELVEISGASSKLPIKNVDMNNSLLLGLDYGKKYTFKYLQGTKPKAVDLIADAYAFQAEEYIPLTSPYKQTENGYFEINLPEGLASGFYYVSDLGFFYYEGGH